MSLTGHFDAIDRRRVAWCLVINGLPYRFYARVAPGTSVTAGKLYDYNANVVQTPTDVNAVLAVGRVRAQFDDLGGIAVQDPVDVTIRAFDARTAAGALVQPYETLMRVAGHDAADFGAKLTATLNHAASQSGPVTIGIDRSASSLTFPRAFHRGQEVIWANNYSDPGGGVYQLTGCTRGADANSTQVHTVSDNPPEQPWITSDVVTWHGRRASIWVSALNASGAAIQWRQYWAGFIDSAPELKGEEITVRVGPLTRVMRYRMGVGAAARAAKSVTGAHFFTAGKGDKLAAFFRWNLNPSTFEATATGGAGTTVTLSNESAAIIDAMGNALALTWETTYGNNYGGVSEDAVSYASPTLTFGAASPLVADVAAGLAAGERVNLKIGGSYVESYPLRLFDPDNGEEVVSWPARLREVVDEAQAWQPGPIESWADPVGAAGDDRLGRIELREGVNWSIMARVKDLGTGTGIPHPWGSLYLHRGTRTCYGGFIAGEDVEDVRGDAEWNRPHGQVILIGEEIYARDEYGVDRHNFAIRGAAAWWYQSGETYIGPFDRDIYTGTGGAAQVLMLTGPGLATPNFVTVTGSQSETHPDTGATIYFYTVAASKRSSTRTVVQMDGDTPVEAVVVASANDTDPPDYILRLLSSGVGNGDNGSNDDLPIGANVASDLIRAGTFNAMAVPEPLRRQDYTAIRGKSIADQTEGLLMACGSVVASRYNISGDWKLELVHTGPADERLSVFTVTDSDLREAGSPLETIVDGRTVRGFTLKLNYSASRGEPVEVPVALVTEPNDAAGDSGSPVVLDLPGVFVDGAGGLSQAAAEIVNDMRARVGAPRVRWRFTIRADKPGALELGIGDVITLTSSYAIAINPTDAVSSVPCRVVGLDRDLEDNAMTLEVRPFAGRVSGYVPAMVVASVVDLDTVTVQASNLSDDDAGWFEQGDPVDCIPAGNWSGRTATTIASKAGTTINFAANHGLAVGDTIRMRDYDTVIAVRAAIGLFAYLADDTDTIGAGNAAGRVIG